MSIKAVIATGILIASMVPAYAQATPDEFSGYSIYTAPRFGPDGTYIAGSTTRVRPDEFGGYSIYKAPRFAPDGAYVPGSTIRVRPERPGF